MWSERYWPDGSLLQQKLGYLDTDKDDPLVTVFMLALAPGCPIQRQPGVSPSK
jgi:hypothetical protein